MAKTAKRSEKAGLTLRQQKLLGRLLDRDNKSISQAARETGVGERTARRWVAGSKFRTAICRQLNAAGIDDQALADKLKELLSSRLTVISKNGTPTDAGPDNKVRLGALTLATKLRGHDSNSSAKHVEQPSQHVHLYLEKHIGPTAVLALDAALRRALAPEQDPSQADSGSETDPD